MADRVEIKSNGETIFKGDDSRLRYSREDHQVIGRLGQMMDRVFCLSCGKDGGFAMKTSLFLYYLCRLCAERFGGLPLPQVPTEAEAKWRLGRTD